MYYPSLAQVKELKSSGNIVPIYREIMADLETPVSAYRKIAHEPYSFLLESAEGGERLARYSFLGTDPYLILQLDNGTARARQNGYKQTISFHDPLEAIASHLAAYRPVGLAGLPRFCGGAVGYLSYDSVRYFEDVPMQSADAYGMPDAVFMFVDSLLVFDHLKHKIKLVSHVHLDGNIEEAYDAAAGRIERLAERLERSEPPAGPPAGLKSSPERRSNLGQADFEAMVRSAKDYIRAGDIIQVVLSQRLSRPAAIPPFNIYRALRSLNPAPYMYYLHLDGCDVVGASPELLVRVEEGVVTTHPIAGTRPRGPDAAADEALAAELAADEKERAEHLMLVDLGRNDIGRVSRPGSVEVTQFMGIERYSHVMHLVSHVKGRLREDLSAYDALRHCFPAGTVSGAPKVRAMEIVAELEPDRRGPYAGAVGYLDYGGNLDTAITIRTIIVKDGVAHVQAGAGIVADSVPELEYRETLNKAQALMRAIEEAEALS